MRRWALVTLLAVVTASSLQSFAAGNTLVAHYIVPSTPGALFADNVPPEVMPDTGYGGYWFPADSRIPTHISVEDVTGDKVALVACQDLSGNGNCELDEPFASICDGDATLRGFEANERIIVFVKAIEPNGTVCSDLSGVATQGTITITMS